MCLSISPLSSKCQTINVCVVVLVTSGISFDELFPALKSEEKRSRETHKLKAEKNDQVFLNTLKFDIEQNVKKNPRRRISMTKKDGNASAAALKRSITASKQRTSLLAKKAENRGSG